MAAVLAVAAWGRRNVPGARAFAIWLGATAAWTAAAAGELLSDDVDVKLLWLRVLVTAGAFTGPAMFVFALHYTGRGGTLARHAWASAAGLGVIPALAMALLWANPVGGRLLTLDEGALEGPLPPVVAASAGPLFVPYAVHQMALATGTIVLLATALPLTRRPIRRLVVVMSAGIAVSTGLSAARLVGIDLGWGTNVRAVSLAQTLVVGLCAFAFGRLRLLDTFLGVGPLARRALAQSLPEGIVVLDTARRVQDLNLAAQRMLGVEEEAVLNRPWEDVVSAAGTPAGALVDGGMETLVTAVGRYEVRRTPLGSSDGGAGQLVILEDVTHLARALHERQMAQDQLIRQERLSALGQMAAGIAHDLDNTLSQVSLYAGLAAEREQLSDDTELHNYLELVRAGLSDATRVVARIREFYRPRSERDTFAPVDLGRVVEETVALTRPRWYDIARATGRTITITRDLGAVPPLLADAAALREALTNLIFNAVDALPQGGEITISLDTSGETVALAVRDNGVGMTSEQQARCLEPFFTTKGVHGTGLGLSMVHGIARRHGGTIEIESEVGRGTWVAMYLNLREAPAREDGDGAAMAAEEVVTAVTAAPVTGADGAAHGRPRRALVVDDETPMRNVISTLLAREGYAVDSAPDGATAQQLINASYSAPSARYDVLILDQVMPGMSGTQLAQTISAYSPRTAVVLLTAFAYMMEGEPLPLGVDVLVSKPFDAPTLRSAVSRACGISAAASQ